ncbi:hypothetical protein K491DRAFT_674311 [Lophiostoma macrostomum CBS 122681]|uniref:Uncharacterized protein n=1 Tax=Lophiostoma macrostomum CBS 122681 TaxID=1314788 RepID=A0A6A6TP89_9PLEO|nr:hypothetical protein K491DRAFT_674311 [Lophiostoma macrostomum CBS 122681]
MTIVDHGLMMAANNGLLHYGIAPKYILMAFKYSIEKLKETRSDEWSKSNEAFVDTSSESYRGLKHPVARAPPPRSSRLLRTEGASRSGGGAGEGDMGFTIARMSTNADHINRAADHRQTSREENCVTWIPFPLPFYMYNQPCKRKIVSNTQVPSTSSHLRLPSRSLSLFLPTRRVRPPSSILRNEVCRPTPIVPTLNLYLDLEYQLEVEHTSATSLPTIDTSPSRRILVALGNHEIDGPRRSHMRSGGVEFSPG